MAVLILLFVILLQLAVYQLLIKKIIAAWGASQAEVAAAFYNGAWHVVWD